MRMMKSRRLQVSAKLAGAALLLSVASGCGQQQNNHHEPVARGRWQAFRTACAGDIQKFCADDQRKRRCLKNNVDKLSDSCKAALSAPRNNGGANNNGGND